MGEEQLNLYVYLPEISYVDTWVSGGKLPISLASKYWSPVRSGSLTPDENLISTSPVDMSIYAQHGIRVIDCVGITLAGNRNGINFLPNVYNVDHYREDGLVLCFSTIFSKFIGEKFRAKACVKIINFSRLKDEIDVQLGCVGKAGNCKYTIGPKRNHFLKSTQDIWQREYRIFWNIKTEKTVNISGGMAEFISKI